MKKMLGKEASRLSGRERDLFLYGLRITDDDLADIWSRKRLVDRVEPAVRLIHRRAGARYLTTAVVAMVVDDDWRGETSINTTRTSMARLTREGRQLRREAYGFNVPALQVYREMMGSYKGNLYPARVRWRNFKPGIGDWLRDVRIPTQIGRYEARWLGVVWGDGTVYSRSLHLTGPFKDLSLYRDIVRPMLREIHNLPLDISKISKPTPNLRGEYTYLLAQVNSKALATWLMYDMRFNPSRGKTHLHIPWDVIREAEQRRGFLEGVVASMGSLTSKGQIVLTDKDETFISGVKRLSEELNYHPNMRHGRGVWGEGVSHMLWYSQREVQRMTLINPAHRG